MSHSTETTIWCDGCGNWEQISGQFVKYAEVEVKKIGWRIVFIKSKKYHFCPKCKENKTY